MKRILVTGGLGFVGSHLVDLLRKDPANSITVIDNLMSESSSRENTREGVRYWIDDIRNLNTVKYSRDEFDVIFHLAALARIQPSFQDPLNYLSINIMGTGCVLDYARNMGSKVVYAGSSTAYGGPMLNPYAYAKHTGEQVCEMYSRVYGLSTAIARFFNVYGERQPITGPYATVVGIFEKQKKSRLPLTVTGDGNQRRDFTHVSDIAQGLVSLSEGEWKGDIFNLGTGKNYSINDLANLFEPDGISYIPKRPGEAQVTLAEISRTTEMTGWKPSVDLETYIKDFLRTL